MTAESPKRIPDHQLDRIKFFMVFIISYILAENIILLANKIIPRFFALSVNVFNNLAFVIYLVIVFLLIVRLISVYLPELNPQGDLPLYLGVISAIILTHPLLIQISGSEFSVNWLVLPIIKDGNLYQLILEIMLYAGSGAISILILNRSEVLLERYHKILRYLGDDLLIILVALVVAIYMIKSFVAESYESITLTIPVKILLLFLFYFATRPLDE